MGLLIELKAFYYTEFPSGGQIGAENASAVHGPLAPTARPPENPCAERRNPVIVPFFQQSS